MVFREIERILKSDGWILVRVCGSHCHYRKPGKELITVPNHKGKDLTIGVLKDLENKTGLPLRR